MEKGGKGYGWEKREWLRVGGNGGLWMGERVRVMGVKKRRRVGKWGNN